MTKTLEEILAIEDVASLNDEEKALLKKNEATLTDEQKTKFAPALEVETPETPETPATPAEETPEEKTAREEKEKGDANEAAGLNRDGSEKTPEEVKASEKKMVQISAAELSILRAKTDQGAEAYKELNIMKLDKSVNELLFSETNKSGTFLPKSKDNLRTFLETLNDTQKVAFSGLLKELPKTQVFEEVGAGSKAAEGSARAEVDTKVDEKMKADEKLSYANALRQVMSENEGLEKRYDEELG